MNELNHFICTAKDNSIIPYLTCRSLRATTWPWVTESQSKPIIRGDTHLHPQHNNLVQLPFDRNAQTMSDMFSKKIVIEFYS